METDPMVEGMMQSIILLLLSLPEDTLKIMLHDLEDVIKTTKHLEKKAVLLEWTRAIQDELEMKQIDLDNDKQCDCDSCPCCSDDCDCDCEEEEEPDPTSNVPPVSKLN